MGRRLLMLLALAMGLSAARAAEPAPATADILKGLASNDFAAREAAQKALQGWPAERWEALRGLAREERDPEVKARLEARVADMLHEIARRSGGAPWEGSEKLVIHLKDRDGKPAAGVRATIKSPSIGRDLWWAFEKVETSDAAGIIRADVPLGEIQYIVTMEDHRYRQLQKKVVVETGQAAEVNWTLEPSTIAPQWVKATLLDEAGNPAANVPLTLVGDYGNSRAGTTDAKGEVAWDISGPYLGQAVPQARVGDLVVPVTMVRTPGPGAVMLRLTPGGHLAGTVKESGTGAPIAGARVQARPTFASGLLVEGVTDEKGNYRIDGVPPGEYRVYAEEALHFQGMPRGATYNLPTLLVASGATAGADLTMDRSAVIFGKVLDLQGRPVPHAMVGVISKVVGDYRNEWRYVQADASGRYAIATAHLREKIRVVACSPQAGINSADVENLDAGDTQERDIRLLGSMRIRGTVADPAGKPIADVTCVNELWSITALSAADGTFDLGRVALTQGGNDVAMRFYPPRPQRNTSITYSNEGVYYDLTKVKVPVFYASASAMAVAEAGVARMKVTLEPAQLLELRGQVTDAAGKGVPGARVFLMTGDAQENTWVDSAVPREMRGDRQMIRATIIGGTQTGETGNWVIHTVRESGPTPFGINQDWSKYAVGVYQNGRAAFTGGVVVPKETGTVRVEMKLP